MSEFRCDRCGQNHHDEEDDCPNDWCGGQCSMCCECSDQAGDNEHLEMRCDTCGRNASTVAAVLLAAQYAESDARHATLGKARDD